ncbi:hypothetical protein HYDPIDRAFT_111635 [Hydnomerulius pinastri MD-312]|uniref:BTB domain-containing protein n=1 Tax=Hydnomerulius pinastri MD-312 TaxID=994086 RepID=A0A0C9VH55_9AGAM|nr:hypothetical protein HYDPIDRAFT_111635 [Hydnomerulius pinastri MD-312]
MSISGDEQDQPKRLEPWMEDGNIVLAAQGNYFRVHLSVLSLHSSIFKDMFISSSPSSGCSTSSYGALDDVQVIDRCPVVQLSDSVEDLQIVLDALYRRSHVFTFDQPMPFSVVAAFLRLGKKYEIRQLFNEAKAKLETSFPCKLPQSDLDIKITGHDPHGFQIINLAHEVGLLSVLPAAIYYFCRSCPLSSILDGYTFEGSLFSLTTPNVRTCAIGREKLLELQSVAFPWLKATASGVRRVRQCSSASCNGLVNLTIARHWHPEPSRDPFMTWEAITAEFTGENVCHTCRATWQVEHQAGRDRAWEAFPGLLGLESWSELERNAIDIAL